MKYYVAVTAVCLLAGCVHASKDAAALLGTEWQLVEIDGKSVAAPTDQQPNLLLDNASGRAQGSGGCNNFNAAFKHSDAALSLSPAMATKRGCDAEVNQIEVAYFQALSDVASQRIDADELQLLDGAGKVLLRLRAKQ